MTAKFELKSAPTKLKVTSSISPFGYPLWFKTKRYGWGWYPVSWQGWIAVIATGVCTTAISVHYGEQLDQGLISLWWFLGAVSLPVLGLIFLAYLTGESPRWRWGGT